MASYDMDFLREKYPHRSDAKLARAIADEEGYDIVVGYRLDADSPGLTNLGCYRDYDEMEARRYDYLDLPGARVVFDRTGYLKPGLNPFNWLRRLFKRRTRRPE